MLKIIFRKNVLIFSIILFVVVLILMPKSYLKINSFALFATTSLIGLISFLRIIKSFQRHSFSLEIMHWMFVLFFYFISPLVQKAANIKIWEFTLSNDECLRINGYVLLWITFYSIGEKLANKFNITLFGNAQKTKREIIVNNNFVLLVTLISVICFMILLAAYGFSGLTARFGDVNEDIITSKMTGLIISKVPRYGIVFAVVVSIIYSLKTKIIWSVIVNVSMLLISTFPFAVSRNMAATVYLGLFLIVLYYKDIVKTQKKPYFIYGFTIGFLVLFPMLNEFRRTDVFSVDILTALRDAINSVKSTFEDVDYDAYSMIAHVRDYTTTYGFSYGKQMLSSLLFFVPRSIWAGKSYGTGQMVFEVIHPSFTNVSCPLIAEGYINFGVIGIILFAIFFGYLSKKIDHMFWENVVDGRLLITPITIIYPFLLPAYFFMLRGDLMTTLAYTLSFVVPMYILSKFGQHWRIRIY